MEILTLEQRHEGAIGESGRFTGYTINKKGEKKKDATYDYKHIDWERHFSGKDFLVYEEQGLGDIIQFCRYLPLLKQKGAEVTFKVIADQPITALDQITAQPHNPCEHVL